MNKLESRYADLLNVRKLAGEIKDWKYEAIKFKLADRTTYTPDFMVDTGEYVEFHETKGFMEEDANVKIKVCAEQFFMFKFVLIKWVKGQWVEREM